MKEDDDENYYNDLNKGWYEQVGENFLLTMWFSMFTPIFRNLAGYIVRKIKARKLKKAKY